MERDAKVMKNEEDEGGANGVKEEAEGESWLVVFYFPFFLCLSCVRRKGRESREESHCEWFVRECERWSERMRESK